jgi:hypothetical protein
MGPSTDSLIASTVAGSALLPKYGTAVDGVSAYEKLAGQAAAPTGPAAPVPGAGADPGAIDAEARRIEEEILGRPSSRPAAGTPAPESAPDYGDAPKRPTPRQAPRRAEPAGGDLAEAWGGALGGGLTSMARSLGTQLGKELLRGVFGTSSKRRRR